MSSQALNHNFRPTPASGIREKSEKMTQSNCILTLSLSLASNSPPLLLSQLLQSVSHSTIQSDRVPELRCHHFSSLVHYLRATRGNSCRRWRGERVGKESSSFIISSPSLPYFIWRVLQGTNHITENCLFFPPCTHFRREWCWWLRIHSMSGWMNPGMMIWSKL